MRAIRGLRPFFFNLLLGVCWPGPGSAGGFAALASQPADAGLTRANEGGATLGRAGGGAREGGHCADARAFARGGG